MQYYTYPPQAPTKQLDVPAFMLKHERYNTNRPEYNTQYLIALFQWAEREYNDTVSYYIATGNVPVLNKLKKINCLYLLAATTEFQDVVNYFNPENFTHLKSSEVMIRITEWNNVPHAIRESVFKVFDIYKKYYWFE